LSWDVRRAALEFIEQHGRPLSISEIRVCLREREDLWSRLEGKSEDYVRVTISTTPGKMFEKYEQLSGSVGVNGNEGVGRVGRVGRGGNEARRLYWGKGGELYGCEWVKPGGVVGVGVGGRRGWNGGSLRGKELRKESSCRFGEGGRVGLVDLNESWVSTLGSDFWVGSEVLSLGGLDWW
jgi:hypothetical protein